jgi:tRNA/rRNA methyltransferase
MGKLCILLDHPQMGENIGAAARAMMNFGLRDLRLIAPRDVWPNERAEALSAGALGAMEAVGVFNTLPDALADLHFVLATTARPRDMVKPVYTPAQAAQSCHEKLAQGLHVGLLFGGERAGLNNEDLTRAHGIITIPTHPDFPTLNLAQSVLLMAYELTQPRAMTHSPSLNKTPARHAEIESFLNRLDEALIASESFYRSEGLKPTMQRNLRNIFMRGDLTQQEVRTLQGVLSALLAR